jgi:hypothetical protein
MADTAPAPSGKGNVLTRKIGPLPTWGWVSIIGGAIVVWAVYARSKAGSTTATAADSASTTPPDVFLVSPDSTTPAGGATTGTVITNGSGGGSTNTTTPPVQTTPSPGPVTTPKPPKKKPGTRLTEKVGQGGITLATFAKRHNWTQAELASVEKLNNLKSTSKLKKGQQLLAPAGR